MLNLLLATIITCFINTNNLYSMTTVVVDINENVLTLEDFEGLIWEYEIEPTEDEYSIGDMFALTMDNRGTQLIYDDVIINAKYDGWAWSWGWTDEGTPKYIFRK